MKLKDYLDIIVIVVVVVLVRTFLITPAKVNGPSMNDTLEDKEIIMVNKINYSINRAKRFDIVVFKLSNGEKLIKRVIGLPGEKIKCKNDTIYINGEKLDSKITFEYTKDFDEVEIPKGYYFVMGDNRDDSLDSRYFGPIESDTIIGTVDFALFPFKRFGKID